MLKISKPLTSIAAVTDGWSSVSPEKQFFGMTLDQYRAAVKPSYDIRAEIAEAQKRLKSLFAKRKDADAAAIKLTKNIVHAVKADPTEGEDSPLYAAMGYVRAADRSSGLTRARVPTSSAPVSTVQKEEAVTT
jgi:hypothetical protein